MTCENVDISMSNIQVEDYKQIESFSGIPWTTKVSRQSGFPLLLVPACPLISL